MSKVVTVQDYLIKKDPEKYKRLLGIKEKEAKKAEKKDNEKRELLSEIQTLRTENKELKKQVESLEKEVDKED